MDNRLGTEANLFRSFPGEQEANQSGNCILAAKDGTDGDVTREGQSVK